MALTPHCYPAGADCSSPTPNRRAPSRATHAPRDPVSLFPFSWNSALVSAVFNLDIFEEFGPAALESALQLRFIWDFFMISWVVSLAGIQLTGHPLQASRVGLSLLGYRLCSLGRWGLQAFKPGTFPLLAMDQHSGGDGAHCSDPQIPLPQPLLHATSPPPWLASTRGHSVITPLLAHNRTPRHVSVDAPIS